MDTSPTSHESKRNDRHQQKKSRRKRKLSFPSIHEDEQDTSRTRQKLSLQTTVPGHPESPPYLISPERVKTEMSEDSERPESETNHMFKANTHQASPHQASPQGRHILILTW